MQCWRGGERVAAEEGGEFVEDPGIADGAAGDPDDVDAGGLVHAEGIFGGEDVAGAEEGHAGGGAFFEVGKKVPVGEASVFLFDSAAVDGDGGELEVAGFVEDLVKPVGGLRGFVKRAAEFDREKPGDGLAHAAHDGDGGLDVGEEISAAAPAHHFFDGAGEVQVDDVETAVKQHAGGLGEFFRFRTHELAGDGMVFVAEDRALLQTAAAAE